MVTVAASVKVDLATILIGVTAAVEIADAPIFVKVLELPEMLLLVSVSVVARPTNVSVEVGRVSVPVFEMLEIIGLVKVLFVSVWVSVVPTIVPLGAVTTDKTPEVNKAIPLVIALFINFPVVSANKANSLATEVAVFEDKSPVGIVAQLESPRK